MNQNHLRPYALRTSRVVLAAFALVAASGLTGCSSSSGHSNAEFSLDNGYGIGGFLVALFGDREGIRSFDELSGWSQPDWMSR